MHFQHANGISVVLSNFSFSPHMLQEHSIISNYFFVLKSISLFVIKKSFIHRIHYWNIMHHFNNNDSNYNHRFTAATILTLAIITTSSMAAAPVAVTATTGTAATTTAPPASPSGIQVSPEPVYQEQSRTVSENLINETHVETTLTANGTLTLPNTTETIDTTATGSILASLADGTAIGQEVITTEDGSESATAKFFGIARFNMEEGTGRAIVISLVDTNSTGRLAVLDGMILAGQVEFQPDETGLLTLWEWQSGVPLPTAITPTATAPTEEPSPLTDTTTTTTNATTTTADTGEPTAAIPEEGEEQQQQQQQTTPTIPPGPNPLFE